MVLLGRKAKVMNITSSIILVKDCYLALERFWNHYSQSPELHLEHWEAIGTRSQKNKQTKKNSWRISPKTRAYSSQLQIWNKTTSLSKLNTNESQLKAATEYCTPWLKPSSCYIPVTFQVWALMNQPLSPHTQTEAFEISRGQLNAAQLPSAMCSCSQLQAAMLRQLSAMSLFQAKLHIQTESPGRWLLPRASIFKLQRTLLVQRTELCPWCTQFSLYLQQRASR